MSGRRIESTTSRTAEWTCLSRAASCLESDSHYRSDDHLALLLVPTFLKLLLHIPLARKFFCRVMPPPGIYEYTIARTKYIDAVFRQVLAEGVQQIVIFGAGFDTRALRFRKEAANAKFFELDVPITQKAKLDQYARRELHIPGNVEFIPIDFNRESVADKLDQGGFRSGRRSLFVLEGLLMYLQPESVAETFKVIEALAGEGSVIVFDYVRASVLRLEGTCYGEKEIVKSVAKAGEKWCFGIEEAELAQFLSQYSLLLSEHRDARDLEQMYFKDPSGENVGRINGTHCLVSAVKQKSPGE